jgi:hypothetical protein
VRNDRFNEEEKSHLSEWPVDILEIQLNASGIRLGNLVTISLFFASTYSLIPTIFRSISVRFRVPCHPLDFFFG